MGTHAPNKNLVFNKHGKELNRFEKDLLKYMHITDCTVITKVWMAYWTFCPVCCAVKNEEDIVVHRSKEDVRC